MKDAGLSAAAIGAFKQNYDQLVAGVTGMVSNGIKGYYCLIHVSWPFGWAVLHGVVQQAGPDSGSWSRGVAGCQKAAVITSSMHASTARAYHTAHGSFHVFDGGRVAARGCGRGGGGG